MRPVYTPNKHDALPYISFGLVQSPLFPYLGSISGEPDCPDLVLQSTKKHGNPS